jgi:cytolysin-activating lysine-acyltransferase
VCQAKRCSAAGKGPATRGHLPDCGKGVGKRADGQAGRHQQLADTSSPGALALMEALAGLGAAPDASSTAAEPVTAHAHEQSGSPSKTVAQVLGEIAWLMTQSPRHKAAPLGDLEWLLMPAILLRQFRIFYKGEQPVGVALWALADDLVARRIDAGDRRLAAVEWKSGSNMRIIDIVAPFGGEAEMREQIANLRQENYR